MGRLGHRRLFEACPDEVVQDSRVLVIRLLGGLGYWREQLEQIGLLTAAHEITLICLPGDSLPDAALASLCTVPLAVADQVFRYCIEGRIENAAAMLRSLSDTLLGTA